MQGSGGGLGEGGSIGGDGSAGGGGGGGFGCGVIGGGVLGAGGCVQRPQVSLHAVWIDSVSHLPFSSLVAQ